MKVQEPLGDRRRNGARHEPIGSFEDSRLRSETRGGGRQFQSDKPATHHDDAPCIPKALGHVLRMNQRAQLHHIVQIGALDRQGAVPRSSRQHEVIVGKPITIAQANAATRAIDLIDALTIKHRNLVVRKEASRAEQELVATIFAEIGL